MHKIRCLNGIKKRNIIWSIIALAAFSSCTDVDIPTIPSFGRVFTSNASTSINDRSIVALADEWSKKFSFDTAFILAVIRQESGFNTTAISRAGAIGLMQLMPGTVSYINSISGIKIEDPTNAYQNIAGGTWYLKKIQSQFLMYPDSWKYALSSYNCGITCVKNAEKKALADYKKLTGYKPAYISWDYVSPYLPFETQNYVPAIMAHYNVYSNPKIQMKYNSSNSLSLENKSKFHVSMRNWKIKNYNGREYKFSSRIIGPKETVNLDRTICQGLFAGLKKNKLVLMNSEGKPVSFK